MSRVLNSFHSLNDEQTQSREDAEDREEKVVPLLLTAHVSLTRANDEWARWSLFRG